MKRTILALLLAAVTAVACNGPRGKAGAQGDTGPQGPPGPISDPPHITSITPEYGSSRTIFTIHGEHFGATAAADTIYVGDETGSKLQVISASTTEIKLTGAFEPVLVQTEMPVSIEVANQISNPILIQAMPSGSTRSLGLEKRIYAVPNQVAASATTLYVLDSSRGVFAQDLASGEITPIVLPGEKGVQTPQQIYVTPAGTPMLVDVDVNGFQRLLARQSDGSWNVELRFGSSLPLPVAFGFGASGDMFLAGGSGVQYVRADGTLGWYAAYPTGLTPIAATTVGGKMYLTMRLNGGSWAHVKSIDASGNQADLNPSVTGPSLITADGTYLYLLDGTTYKRVDPATAVTTNVGNTDGHTATWIAAAPGRLFQADTSCEMVFEIGATSNKLTSGGLYVPQQISAGGGGDLLVTTMPLRIGSDYVTALYEMPADGAVRIVDGTHAYSSLQHEGSTALFIDGFKHTVNEVALATGAATKLADSTQGLVNPTGIAKAADGTIFVVDQPTPGTTSIATISGGALHLGFATANVPLYAAEVSGSELFLAGSAGVYGVPLSGGSITLLTVGPNAPFFSYDRGGYAGRLAADGAGGVYLSDWNTKGTVLDLAVDGSLTVLSSEADPQMVVVGVTVDPASGNLRTGNTLPASPSYEMFP